MSRLFALGIGAALMFFTDPQSGRKRRDDFRNQVDTANRRLRHARDVIATDATNRAHGALVETRKWLQDRRAAVREGELLPRDLPSVSRVASNLAAPWLAPHWSPTQRAAAGALGAGMAMYGYFRGGFKGLAYTALGGALVARATTNRELVRTAANDH